MKFFKNKGNFFLVLDIGTEAVKCLICHNFDKIIVLGTGLEYFNKFGVFNNSNIRWEIIKKASEAAIEEACSKVSSSADKKIREKALDRKKWQVFISLPPDIFKARIIYQTLFEERGKISSSEEKNIYKRVLEAAQKRISDEFAEEFNILPNDITWISYKILEIKIEGYQVPMLHGYEGKEIEFKILASFAPKYYVEEIKKTMDSLGFNNFKIIHLAEGIANFFKKKISGVIIDVGGQSTQVFGIKDGKLEYIKEYSGGGSLFTKALSENLGLDEDASRVMIERHSKEKIDRFKEIFLWEKNEWYNDLKKKFNELASKGVFPYNIFLLGGASRMPEIKDVLTENKDGLSNPAKIRFIGLEDLAGVEDAVNNLNNPQWISSLLICYNINK